MCPVADETLRRTDLECHLKWWKTQIASRGKTRSALLDFTVELVAETISVLISKKGRTRSAFGNVSGLGYFDPQDSGDAPKLRQQKFHATWQSSISPPQTAYCGNSLQDELPGLYATEKSERAALYVLDIIGSRLFRFVAHNLFQTPRRSVDDFGFGNVRLSVKSSR